MPREVAIVGEPPALLFEPPDQPIPVSPADLVIVAARPSMGKTALALNVAWHVATKNQLPVAIFSSFFVDSYVSSLTGAVKE